MALTTPKSARSARKMVQRTTWSKESPAAVSTAPRFFITWVVWALTSPGTSSMVAGSRGICPERKTIRPAGTATA